MTNFPNSTVQTGSLPITLVTLPKIIDNDPSVCINNEWIVLKISMNIVHLIKVYHK